MSTDTGTPRADWFTAISVALGVVAVPIIAFLGIIATLSLEGARQTPTPAEIIQYWVVVGVAVVVQLVALLRSSIRRRAWLMVAHSALILLIAVTAIFFAIPEIEWLAMAVG